jgi:exodeoxyribonuclease VII large subunit
MTASNLAQREGAHIFSVRQFTQYLRGLIERDDALRDVRVRGEISNCRRFDSGHTYFTLKDEFSQLECALFREEAAAQEFSPQDGLRVIARGRITVYERRGQYQLVVAELRADGVGALWLAFEQLKKKLEAEGLFRPDRKRPLPRFPGRVALVTSTDGAVLHDFVRITRERWPALSILVVPAQVTGQAAAPLIVKAMTAAQVQPEVQAIVLARGGGSLEELWAFNTEIVARAIAACSIPVVSAIGHETDYTIADFVADVRAPTPTAAAMLVAPDRAEIVRQVSAWSQRASGALSRRLAMAERELKSLAGRRVISQPLSLLDEPRRATDELFSSAKQAIAALLQARADSLAAVRGRLVALNPRGILARGYAIVERMPERNLVKSVSQVEKGDQANITFQDGYAACRITQTGKENDDQRQQ